LVDKLQTSDDYILDKLADRNIYEITYTIPESLRDKFSHFLSKAASKALLWSRFK